MNKATVERDRRAEILTEVVAAAAAGIAPAQGAQLGDFIYRYYGQVDAEDLAERTPADLAGAARSQWELARVREAGRANVRVFNPTRDEHGWQSTHTIVEISNDDMPFLVDSVTMEVNRHGLTQHLIIHPIVAAERDAAGVLTRLVPEGAAGGRAESFIHAEVDRITDAGERDALAADLQRVLADVRAAVEDWPKMTANALAIVENVERTPPPLPAAEVAEGAAFLRWLVDNHFTFVGHRSYALDRVDGEDVLRIVPGSSLGVLRDRPGAELAARFSALPPELRAYARRPELLVVTKATARSTVHRAGYLDHVGVKRFDAQGQVCGEDRFLGLFTSTAYSAHPADIPLLRRKIANVIAAARLPEGSHAYKGLVTVLETYPRDELFQMPEEQLLPTAMAILHLNDRQRFRLFVRRDPFERFLSCLIYAPRENYTTELRQKWQAMLAEACNGTSSDFNVHLSESMLARIQITVRTTPGKIPAFDVHELEARLGAIARRWTDELRAALIAAEGEARGNELYRRFGAAFPAGYREDFAPRAAVADIALMDPLGSERPLALSLYRAPEGTGAALRFKLIRSGAPVMLSEALPMLEHMGFRVQDEHPYRIVPAERAPISMLDFGIAPADAGRAVDVEAVHAIFEDAFARIFRGEVENDDFNRLVAAAHLPLDEVVVLRAYAKYLRQVGFALSQAFIEATLAAHARIARLLVEMFKARFDPALGSEGAVHCAEKARAIEAALDAVDNLSEDRVLRAYVALIDATTRTNYWRRDDAGRRRPFLSFKFDPARVPDLPEPKPMFEIFVYSTRFEGVHLRGGKVARGGLRWSDRPEDFRTEILGLVKAQMVKNIVIVPVGSKGGFVLKRAPAASDRDAYMKEGVACYQDYLRGLLDLTDNRVGDRIVPPPQVKRHDADDPYLVVAADKGTATFSDYANAVSQEYGFWLGDAFASGGSAGYDHKVMGITARGAWEAAKRHFRELGVDIQTTPFTVVGIGDMSGDVFGNGMLLSREIRLVAAFDHRHILLDPDPDPAASFAERERLFELPRSTWADYDARVISKGGGVHARSAKSIAITDEVKAALAIDDDHLTPTALITAILKAPVDLIYNGGIGTYVKAKAEPHAAVGDRANDALRVNGRDLRCKVVVEGGNLGCTQLGRIEYALAGGRINTDAIDNSGGVDTSDHEVNIKILLGLTVADGRLTLAQRDTQLAAMTDEVAALVLRDNYFQTQVLSVTGRIAPQLLDAQQRFIRFLEKAGRLNRALEFLPSDEEIAERRRDGIGFTCPERAVLLAYAKIWLYDELVASILPDDPWVATALVRYFPHALRERYAAEMARHPLKREIIATYVTNSMLNRVGSTFVHRLMETTGAAPQEVVRAFLLTREVFGFVPMWKAIEALDNRVDDAVQASLLIDSSRLIDRGTTWFLRSRRLQDEMAATIARYAPGVEALAAALPRLLDGEDRAHLDAAIARSSAQGTPPELAARVVALDTLYAALDIVEEAGNAARPAETVARIYFETGAQLGLPWLRERVAALPAEHHWQVLGRGAMLDDLSGLQRAITRDVLSGGADATAPRLITAWQAENRRPIDRVTRLLAELRNAPAADAAMLSVALRELRNLTAK
jgi:glutamate dehydrogenase